MVLHVTVDVKKIYELGKTYPWPRPKHCLLCKSTRIWSHGYVQRYFEDFKKPLWIKRYRCPDCHTVYTLRPDMFYMRFRYPIRLIIYALIIRIVFNTFIALIPRQNQQYWYKGLIFQASRINNIPSPDISVLNDILSRSITPVSHSFKCAIMRL